MEHPSLQYLHECFDLDVSKGELRWRMRPERHFPSEGQRNRFNSRWAGEIAGYRRKRDGRRYVSVDGSRYLSYRLIYALHHEIPLSELPDLIDHKDGNALDDRPSNLRPATCAQNQMNRRRRIDGASGFKGVAWKRQLGRWTAQIMVNGKSKHLGVFDDPAEAHSAYMAEAKIHFGEFARYE